MAKSEEPITIKKYANRRLYNTGTSTYVTLEDLATMVKAARILSSMTPRPTRTSLARC
jgi:polyhydroxyalkanoate synthesis regulator protein